MCLWIDDNVKLPPQEKRNYFVGYKVLQRYASYIEKEILLKSPYRYAVYNLGINKAEGECKPGLMYNFSTNTNIKIVSGGAIHVFLTKKEAASVISKGNPFHRVIVPVRCFYKDVVAVGTFEGDQHCVAMKKVTLDKRSYIKAILTKF